jgi:hypothetical protein
MMSWSSDEYDANLRSIPVLFFAEVEYSDFEPWRLRVRSCSELCQHANISNHLNLYLLRKKCGLAQNH